LLEVRLISTEERMTENTFGRVMTCLMKAIHVELTNKTVHFCMTKVSRQYDLLKFCDVFDYKLYSWVGPPWDLRELRILIRLESTLRISKVLPMKPAISPSWSPDIVIILNTAQNSCLRIKQSYPASHTSIGWQDWWILPNCSEKV
jgi:hypothetical protein